MGNLLKLDDRRTPSPTSAGSLVCSACGSAYFQLLDTSSDGTKTQGLVTINAEGDVDGYTGIPHCAACGHAQLP